jgi:hypothetical protein
MLEKYLREVGVLGIPVHTCVLFLGWAYPDDAHPRHRGWVPQEPL